MEEKYREVGFWVVFRSLIDNPFAYMQRLSSASLHSYVLQEFCIAPVSPTVAVLEAFGDPKNLALEDFLKGLEA